MKSTRGITKGTIRTNLFSNFFGAIRNQIVDTFNISIMYHNGDHIGA